VKLALHGHGKMGRAVERIAAERGHEIVALCHRDANLNGAEAIIDFSQAPAVAHAVELACANGVNLVIGTTGWKDDVNGQWTLSNAFLFGSGNDGQAMVAQARLGAIAITLVLVLGLEVRGRKSEDGFFLSCSCL